MPLGGLLTGALAAGGGAAAAGGGAAAAGGAAGAAGGAAGAAGGAAGAAGGAAGMLPGLMKSMGGSKFGAKAAAGVAQGLITGLIQGMKAKKAKRAADDLMPALYDPQQAAQLNEIQQKARSINTGSAFAADMGQIDATTAGTNQAIVQAAGGDVSGTIQGLLSAQSNAGRAKNQVLGQADQQNQFYNTMAADLQNRVSSRALELQMHLRNQRLAEGAQYAQDGFSNAAAGMAMTDPGAIDWMDVLQTARKNRPTREGAALSRLQNDPNGTPVQQIGSANPIENILSDDSGSQGLYADEPVLERQPFNFPQ